MKNVAELTQQLSAVFQDLKAGTIQNKHADALANIAGKIISAHKVQVAYFQLKNAPSIAFLKPGPDEDPDKRIDLGKPVDG